MIKLSEILIQKQNNKLIKLQENQLKSKMLFKSISTIGNFKSSSKSSMIASSGSSSSQGSNRIQCFTGCVGGGIFPIIQTSINIDIDINISISCCCGCGSCGGCACRC
ncbi:hypothetical protein ACTFIZ_001718 [Dictyostelium cf. discoideum]